MTTIAHAAKFSFDEGPSFEGWTFGNRWNGWGCPMFELETARRVAGFFNTIPDTGGQIRFDENTRVFRLETGHADQNMTWAPFEIITNSGLRTVYDLGSHDWCWWVE